VTSNTGERADRSLPGFLSALRGVWLFTWKSQLTWRRLGIGLLSSLALPALIYLTTPSPQSWARSHRLQMGNPGTFLNGFAKRANRAGCPLQPKQRAELGTIVSEEFAKAEGQWETPATADPDWERQQQQSDACFEAILQRAGPVLEENQLAELRSFQQRHRTQRAGSTTEPRWGRTGSFYHCLVDLYFFIILPLNCVSLCGAVIRDELEADTLSFLTTRPLSRASLLLLKFLSQTASIEIWLAAQTILIFVAGRLRDVPDLGALLPAFLGAQVLAVPAWSALGLLLGQISRRYMAIALVYGAIVEMGIGRIPTNINTLSLMRHLKTLLSHCSALQNVFNWPTASLATPLLALLGATVLFLAAAALLFNYKEYHHTTEMQK
jgi:hypothetical protein